MSVKTISVKNVRENPIALRGVNRESEKYIQLRDSIRRTGILSPPSVREKTDEEGQSYFEVVDGLQRYSCACDLGFDDIPVNIVALDEVGALEAQIMGNLHRVDTKPVQYARQLVKILGFNPTMTKAEMCERLAVSPAWLNQRLGLLDLTDEIQELVDEGKIKVSNAQQLSKLPANEQANFVDSAMTMEPTEFGTTVAERVKAIKESQKQGKAAPEEGFTPTAHLRKLSQIKSENNMAMAGPSIVNQLGLSTPAEGFAAGVQWVLSLDPETVAEKQAAYDARMAAREEAKQQRALERAKQKEAEAAKVVADLST